LGEIESGRSGLRRRSLFERAARQIDAIDPMEVLAQRIT